MHESLSYKTLSNLSEVYHVIVLTIFLYMLFFKLRFGSSVKTKIIKLCSYFYLFIVYKKCLLWKNNCSSILWVLHIWGDQAQKPASHQEAAVLGWSRPVRRGFLWTFLPREEGGLREVGRAQLWSRFSDCVSAPTATHSHSYCVCESWSA